MPWRTTPNDVGHHRPARRTRVHLDRPGHDQPHHGGPARLVERPDVSHGHPAQRHVHGVTSVEVGVKSRSRHIPRPERGRGARHHLEAGGPSNLPDAEEGDLGVEASRQLEVLVLENEGGGGSKDHLAVCGAGHGEGKGRLGEVERVGPERVGVRRRRSRGNDGVGHLPPGQVVGVGDEHAKLVR